MHGIDLRQGTSVLTRAKLMFISSLDSFLTQASATRASRHQLRAVVSAVGRGIERGKGPSKARYRHKAGHKMMHGQGQGLEQR